MMCKTAQNREKETNFDICKIQRGFIFPMDNRYQTRNDVTLYKRATFWLE